jgi:hypothetical protein
VIKISSIYEDVAKDSANEYENGRLSIDRFNRFSRRAELSLIDWLTGGAAPDNLPTAYLTQKDKNWLSPFILSTKGQVLDGRYERPKDYYQKDALYRLGPPADDNTDCNDDKPPSDCNTPIEILDGKEFDYRCTTWIDELKPTFNLPIAKWIGDELQFSPRDIGAIGLDYIRYPVFGVIVPTVDPVYNQEIPDENASTNYEWPEAVRNIFVFMITDMFANNTREQALKEMNVETGKTERERR